MADDDTSLDPMKKPDMGDDAGAAEEGGAAAVPAEDAGAGEAVPAGGETPAAGDENKWPKPEEPAQ